MTCRAFVLPESVRMWYGSVAFEFIGLELA